MEPVYSPEVLPANVQKDIQDLSERLHITPADLPDVITKSVDQIKVFADKKDNAIACAEKARIASESAKAVKVTFFKNKRVAIEQLQDAVLESVDAIDSLVDAQSAAFESIQKIAEAEKFLLAIGVMNSALNRMVIRELELRLKNASQEKLTAQAKKEIESIINQLHAQEDESRRIESHAQALHEHEESISRLESEIQLMKSKSAPVYTPTEANEDTTRDTSEKKSSAGPYIMAVFSLLIAIATIVLSILHII